MTGALSGGAWNWIEAGLAFFYPNLCQVCASRRATPRQGYICGECARQVRFLTPPFCQRCGLPFEGAITEEFECSNCRDLNLHFTHARSAVIARGLVREVIHRYKYQRALWFEPFLSDLLVRQATPVLVREKWDAIVPVPLHPLKLREREFNQAERLARRLGAAVKIPVNANALQRVQSTKTQTMLSRSERAENVRRAFVARPRQDLKGARIILVDDVFTTGATTSACANALQRVGAGDVCVWTVARGL